METTKATQRTKAEEIAAALNALYSGRTWTVEEEPGSYGVRLRAPDALLLLEVGGWKREGRLSARALTFEGEQREGEITVAANRPADVIAREIERRVLAYAINLYFNTKLAHETAARREAYEEQVLQGLRADILNAPGYIDTRTSRRDTGIEWRPEGGWHRSVAIKLDLWPYGEEGEEGTLTLSHLPLPIVRCALEAVLAGYMDWGRDTLNEAARAGDRMGIGRVGLLMDRYGIRSSFELVSEHADLPWMLPNAYEAYGKDRAYTFRVTLTRTVWLHGERSVTFYWLDSERGAQPSPLWPAAALQNIFWRVMPTLNEELPTWAERVGIKLDDLPTPEEEEQSRDDGWLRRHHGGIRGPARYAEYRRLATELRRLLAGDYDAFALLIGSAPEQQQQAAEAGEE